MFYSHGCKGIGITYVASYAISCDIALSYIGNRPDVLLIQ